MDAPRDPRSSTGTRNFRLFWSAQSSSLVGMQVGMVAVPLLAIDVLGADAAQVALIGTLTALPWLIAPVIGAVVHRVDRPRLLTVSHFARALLWLTIPVALLGILTMPQLWLVAGATAVLGVAFAVGYRSLLSSTRMRSDRPMAGWPAPMRWPARRDRRSLESWCQSWVLSSRPHSSRSPAQWPAPSAARSECRDLLPRKQSWRIRRHRQ